MEYLTNAKGSATLLLRNPYAAIVSYWNHAATADRNTQTANPRIAADMRTPQFREFVDREIE